MTFSKYTDIALSVLEFNPKFRDMISRKQEILSSVYQFENLEPESVLYVGFNPSIFECKAKVIAVTEISEKARKYLINKGLKFLHIEESNLSSFRKKFQCVVAMDEYFTFAKNDQDQQNKIKQICDLASALVVSTVRDYKNQDFKDREFSQPVSIRNSVQNKIYFEYHDSEIDNKIQWKTTTYEINYPNFEISTYGPYQRRAVYFKQLAKFSIDAGATNFVVHKNLMYKSLIKRNYEHVVSIRFND